MRGGSGPGLNTRRHFAVMVICILEFPRISLCGRLVSHWACFHP